MPNLIFAPLLLALAVACSNGGASGSQSGPEAAGSPSIGLAGRVTDAAEILTQEQEAGLSKKLEKLEFATDHQMAVVTVPTLGGRNVAAFTRDLANSWGIGREGHDDGVVLLVAPKERKARIAVGYGLEKTLPDALCEQIRAEQMIPRFQEGNFAGGLEAGVDALSSRLHLAKNQTVIRRLPSTASDRPVGLVG